MALLDPNQSYTFSRYFELGLEAKELAAEFGYTLNRKVLNLPQFSGELDRLQELRERLEEVLPYVPLTSELARREILISRVVTELIHYTRAELRIEYPLKVSSQLQGSLDYLLRIEQPSTQLLVIEAKYEDITRGFTQLVAELAAIDRWDNSPNVSVQPIIVGAVSTGTLWQFATLDRANQHFEQGINSYRVPEDLDPLMRILIAALKGRE
ncbi:hypothetical protein H6G20_03040 [Desertifilum sp. FACHB-1129]|uniref:Uncharacterized protein n=2 Tax=Desertifilum tharense IPPAS B-1220 TaxID=1781255 RepID=A0A1E5QPV0_9CYAN|nr:MULTISPECIES: hypothetical protein [Desertifilum]MDA0209857.1 hypothetical protein [Cyanobacteria bacterium FC1]MBD2310653.1 hypothetical protein [Desertifilum sp. FACHB-1129]MBD2320690.1 hypothetical protein [Desertifilum sp. FACHB-866]MBD2330818.1 hypothetical protein [Desertifilum sp. FACHB-868]OEJ76634.1 hypothetical protein BH720_03500 [Desertifilum tharense IPPAS B-1220]